jgi:FKBP-type peptidyl-prolyl cis-trans isomerase SlyD
MVHSSLQVGPGMYVTLSYVAHDEDGEVVETAEPGEPLTYVHGYGQLPEGLERGIEGMITGQEREVRVEAEQAYGQHNPDGVFEVDRSDFPEPESVELDDDFVVEGPDGEQLVMRVIDILEGAFLVDTNHPLAGVNLRYAVKIEAVRDATEEELAEAERELEDDGACGCGEAHDGDHPHDHGHDEGAEAAAGDLVQLRVPSKDGRPS